MHARSEWTNRVVPNPAPQRGVGVVFIHHEGGPQRGNPADKPAVLRGIESGVLGKGYTAIDYNLMVFNDGSVWEGRGLGHEDGATLHWNERSISVCGVGNYTIEPVSAELIEGCAQAVAAAIRGGWTTAQPDVRPHSSINSREFSTACPGALADYCAAIRARAISLATNQGDDDMTPEQAQQLKDCHSFDAELKNAGLMAILGDYLHFRQDVQALSAQVAKIAKKLGA